MNQINKFKETEIGMIPDDWEIVSLEEVTEIIDCLHSIKPAKKESGYIYLEVFNLDGKTADINKENLTYINKEDYDYWTKRTVPQYGDLVITNTGIAVTAMIPKDFHCCIGRNMTLIKPKKQVLLPEFLRFYSLSDLFKREVQRLSLSGTILESLHVKYVGKIRIGLPKIEEQKKIIQTISSFFEKESISRQMNKTLEAIGKALFNQWFVNFELPDEKGRPYKSSGGEMIDSELGEIPKGWKEGVFSDIVTNIKYSLKKGDNFTGRKYVPIDCIPMNKIGIEEFKEPEEAESSLIAFEKDDILFGAMRAYFHRVNIAPFSGITRATVFVLRGKKQAFITYSLFLLNQDSSVEYANSHSKGSTMPYAVWDGSLANMPIIFPDETILKKYYSLTYPLILQINQNLEEIRNLKKMRNSLLPKLMSGQIRVKWNG